MSTAWRLALADLRARFGLLLGAALLVAVPTAGFLLLDGYARGINRDFAAGDQTDLIVQESNSVGEVTGSRLDASVEDQILATGVAWAIPEIHSVAGSSAENAVLIRGVDLDRYRSITEFEVVDGRPLQPGDPPTAVFLGADVADSRGGRVGGQVLLRGRPYDVVGIFRIGTYADNEAWLSLAGARDLLGWGDEISVVVVPDDGTLHEGDVLPGPLSVARRGDFVSLADEWDPILTLAGFATAANAAAAAIILAAVLWRLAWLRRRDLAILRTIGMGRSVVGAYLSVDGVVVAGTGFAAGIVGALALAALVQIEAFGFNMRAVYTPFGMVRGAVLTAAILAFALVVATARAVRARPAELLRGD